MLQHLGVAATDSGMGQDYAVYHSVYDNYDWMTRFGDPGFHKHVACTQFWGLLGLRVADADVLPFDFRSYASELEVRMRSIGYQIMLCAVAARKVFVLLRQRRRHTIHLRRLASGD